MPASAPAPEQQPKPARRRVVGHALLATIFTTLIGLALGTAHRRGRIPERLEGRDIALLGVASFRSARLLSRNKVTDFVRAPFLHAGPSTAPGEVSDTPREGPVRGTIGELLACPFCLSVWTSGALLGSLLHAPRATRMVAGMAASVTVADALNQAYVLLDRMRDEQVHEAKMMAHQATVAELEAAECREQLEHLEQRDGDPRGATR